MNAAPEPEPLPVVASLVGELPPAPVHEPATTVPASPRTIRLVELILLLAVAFGGALYASAFALLGTRAGGSSGSSQWLYSLIHESTGLGLCAYLLHKQGRSFRQLGLNFRPLDLVVAPGLMVAGLLCTMTVIYGLYFSGHYSATAQAGQAAAVAQVAGSGLGWGMVIFTVVNGFFEELIVRAYLMTDVWFLTGKTALAVVASAVFQGVYHLYQGWQAALAVTVGFLVFSLFYARTRRVTPIILAHVLWDLCMLAGYGSSGGQR